MMHVWCFTTTLENGSNRDPKWLVVYLPKKGLIDSSKIISTFLEKNTYKIIILMYRVGGWSPPSDWSKYSYWGLIPNFNILWWLMIRSSALVIVNYAGRKILLIIFPLNKYNFYHKLSLIKNTCPHNKIKTRNVHKKLPTNRSSDFSHTTVITEPAVIIGLLRNFHCWEYEKIHKRIIKNRNWWTNWGNEGYTSQRWPHLRS